MDRDQAAPSRRAIEMFMLGRRHDEPRRPPAARPRTTRRCVVTLDAPGDAVRSPCIAPAARGARVAVPGRHPRARSTRDNKKLETPRRSPPALTLVARVTAPTRSSTSRRVDADAPDGSRASRRRPTSIARATSSTRSASRSAIPLPLLLHHDRERPIGTRHADAPTAAGIAFEATLPTVDDARRRSAIASMRPGSRSRPA